MKNEKSIQKLFKKYKDTVARARLKKATRAETGKIFKELVYISASRSKLYANENFGRSSIDRYIQGETLPHHDKMFFLEQFFLGTAPPSDDISCEELVSERFRSLIAVIAAYNEENSDSLPSEKVSDLVTVMRKSHGTFTKEVILAFLGVKLSPSN